jgi:integrase
VSTYKPKNSTVFLYDFQLNGNRFHGSTGCKTKRDADRVEARKRAEAALDDGKRKKPPITLDDAAGLYDARLKETGKWSATADYIMAGLVESLGGNKHLSEITQEDLSRHFAKRAGHVSASTVNREIEVARPIWRRVAKTHDIGEMPDWGQLRYAVPAKDPRELYRDEEERLLPAMRDDLKDFTHFALLSGWRLAEVRNLRWVDVRFPERTALTRIKGGDEVTRVLTTDMLCIIANQPKVGPFVFTYVCQKSRAAYTDKLGRKHPARLKGERYPFSQTGWRKPWAAALKAAGIESFRFHDLRHTRGTRILRMTDNLVLAKEALKHKHIKTTLRYAHASADDVRRGLDASESRTIPEVAASNGEKARKSAENGL